jgi:O-antigen/teichoic acid export membrane protein
LKLLKQIFHRIKASLFLQNVATLASGSTFAQAISVFTAPILYRIYDKEDYGTLGLYMAIVGVIGVFSTLQYDHAILLEKDDEDAKVLMWLNRIINTGVALLTFLIVIFFGAPLGNMLGNPEIIPWLYLAPFSIFFSGQGQIFSVWANRKKKYRILTMNSILTALSVPAVSISVGVFNNGPLGLFLGIVTSSVIPTIILLVALSREESFRWSHLHVQSIKLKIKEYKKFPIYNLPSAFIGVFSKQLPVFFLSRYAGPASVGMYNLCVRMLAIPAQIIGNAISSVYRQRAIEDLHTKSNFLDIHKKTFKGLFLVSIIPILSMLIYGPDIFSFVFGAEWIESGVISQILIVMFAFQLIISPLSYAYIIKEKLPENMLIHTYILISSSLIFYLGFEANKYYLNVLMLYGINYSIVYLIYLIRSFKLAS